MVHLGTGCLRRLSQGDKTAEIRFGRLLRHPKVTLERLVDGWSTGTAAAVTGRHVLAIQDTTELNFRTSEGHDRGLGAIGKGVGRGLLLHPMIALDAGPTFNGGKPPAEISFGDTSIPNPRKNSAPRTILGTRQKQWFMNQLRRSTATWKIWGNSLGTLDWRADPQNLPEGLTKQKWPADTFAQVGSGDFGSA